MANKLGIRRIIIPHQAGVGSAIGFLLAPVSFEHAQSWVVPLHRLNTQELQEKIEIMTKAASALAHMAKPEADLERTVKATMRYIGQGHEVDAVLGSFSAKDAVTLRNAFEEQYKLLYGRLIPGIDIELVTLVVRVCEVIPAASRRGTNLETTWIENRETQYICVDKGRRRLEIAGYRRNELQAGHSFKGPAIIREEQTTTLVPDAMRVSIDDQLNIIMETN